MYTYSSELIRILILISALLTRVSVSNKLMLMTFKKADIPGGGGGVIHECLSFFLQLLKLISINYSMK